MIERRRFIKGCAAQAAVLLAPGAVLGATDHTVDEGADPYALSGDTFRSLVKQDFRCEDREGRAVTLELVEVWRGPPTPGLDQFSTVFRVRGIRRAKPLPADLYWLHHRHTGRVLVHLAPSAQGEGHYTTHFGLFT